MVGNNKIVGISRIACVIVFLTVLSTAGEQSPHARYIVSSDTLLFPVAGRIQAGPFADLSRETKRAQHLVRVKYRSTPVDVADPRFEYLDTSISSFVTGAWYDESNMYMVIGLKGTYYHYCRMPRNAWDSFRSADSFGRHYNGFIKGRFDCRLGGVPEY